MSYVFCAHSDFAVKPRESMLAKFQDACADYGSVDKKPVLEGRQMTMFINPLKQSKDQPPKEQ